MRDGPFYEHVGFGGVYKSYLFDRFSWVDYGFGGRLTEDWPLEPTASLTQVHGDAVLEATLPGRHGDGDALITSTPGLYLAIRTADCLPILLVDARQRKVAAIHAGWRGTVAGIAAKTVAALDGDPADVWAAFGPGIGPCCFEVNDDVASEFGARGRCSIDLFAHNRKRLLDIGVPGDQIASDAPCTCCDAVRFHSFRRDKQDAGRMVAAIAVKPKAE